MCEAQKVRSTETAPDQCPNGHDLIGGTCLVGWEVCGCASAGHGGHRTYFCRHCDTTLYVPPCSGTEFKPGERWATREQMP
jgi:hypothetical protein